MKVTETTANGEIREYAIPFVECKPQVAKLFGAGDEPLALYILKSGWGGYYHVLLEFGDCQETDYHFLRADQIREKFGVDIDACSKDVVVNHNTIYETPNLYDLGTKISREYFQLNHKADPHTNNENLF